MKTYIFYLGRDWYEHVRSFDLNLGKWGNDIGINSSHGTDTHNYPSGLIDNLGYLHCFYGCHATSMYYKKSINPYDETNWGSEINIDPSATYPKSLVDSNNVLYVFYRAGSSEQNQSFKKSIDGGNNWSNVNVVIDTGAAGKRVYVGKVIIGSDDSIHIVWTMRLSTGVDDPAEFHNCMYLKSLDGGISWKKSDGSNYSLPITYEASEAIATGIYLWAASIFLDTNNNPHVLYLVSDPDVYFLKNHIHYCYLLEGNWQDIILPEKDYAIGTKLVVVGSTIYVFSSQLISGVMEIVKLVSIDNGANWIKTQLTSGSPHDNLDVVAIYEGGHIQITWVQDEIVYFMLIT